MISPAFTGVDGLTSTILGYPNGAQAILTCNTSAATPTAAVIAGTDARIDIDPVYFTPTSFTVVTREGEAVRHDPRSRGPAPLRGRRGGALSGGWSAREPLHAARRDRGDHGDDGRDPCSKDPRLRLEGSEKRPTRAISREAGNLVEARGRELHFGVQLTAQDTTWERFAEAVCGVEELGFDSIWTFDHLLASGGRAGPCFETLTTLSAMALLTRSARIGVLIAGVAYRDPVTLAKSAAQVDQMSGGRLEFSLGAAWAKREFEVYGLPFPPLAQRYERLDEALDLVKLLWTEPIASYTGQYYSVHDAPCDPKPVQQPFPPITVGGSGDGLLAVAAKHATRVNMQGTPSFCAERSRRLSEFCSKAGRDFDEIELSLHASVVAGAEPLSR